MDDKLKNSYLMLCNDSETNENDIQNFLEEHTQLIPLPILENHHLSMNVVISKFKLGNDFVTDFAYLTKSTSLWRFVLIELENQHKKIFKESNNRIEFSAEFNKGIDQIRSWKIYIDNNKNKVLDQIAKIRCPLENNTTYFSYVLIIGRNEELTEKRRNMLANFMEESNIKILTYDSLISRYTYYSGVDSEKVVLSPWKEQGFSIKSLPKGEIDTSLFSMVSPEYLSVSKEQEQRLKTEGYEIDQWRNGFSLVMNNKKAYDLLGEKHRFN